MKKTLKSMSVSECGAEIRQHRNTLRFLVLERMAPACSDARKAEIAGTIAKLHRRLMRLEGQLLHADWLENYERSLTIQKAT